MLKHSGQPLFCLYNRVDLSEKRYFFKAIGASPPMPKNGNRRSFEKPPKSYSLPKSEAHSIPEGSQAEEIIPSLPQDPYIRCE